MISVDGIVLPNRPLSNLEITDSVKKLRIPSFRGVFVRDTLPRTPNKNVCGTLNLDDSSGNGTHWVFWYRNNNTNFYFVSCGVQPPQELQRYLKSAILYTTEKGEVFCGHLCLHALKQLSLGCKLQDIVNDLH